MIVAVSGYNASGKTTLVRALGERLQQHDVPYTLVKCEQLYPGTWLKRRRRRQADLPAEEAARDRQLRGLRYAHDRTFRLRDLGNLLCAAVALWLVRAVHNRKVIVVERYFYDRLIFFSTRSRLYRLAIRMIPRPRILFFLVPDEECWRQRFLGRVRQKTSTGPDELSEADAQALALIRSKYEEFHRIHPDSVLVNSTTDLAIREAWDLVASRLRNGSRRIA
jgi:thymidylate kinase